MYDFSRKTVFVSGGTSGINQAIALGFAKANARVCVISRNPDKVDNTVEALKHYRSDCFGYSCDVRDYAALSEVLGKAAKKFGQGVDVLVSGAAGNFPAYAKDMSANAFKSVVDIDLLGTFNVAHAAFGYLTKSEACIVNISAPQSLWPAKLQSHVCAAKAGVDMITRTLAMEWGEEGIRVNSIVPGPVEDTEGMARLAPTGELQKKVAETVPLGRLASSEDIVRACLWLSSEDAGFVHGVVLPVDGGWCLGGWSECAAEISRFYDSMN